MGFNFISFLILSSSCILSFGCQYEKFSQHTMCIYNENGCKYEQIHKGVSKEEINKIFNVHNSLRNKVAEGREPGQPTASNMYMLTWDPELATIAQRWADQCQFGHDSVRTSFKLEQVGQNVALVSTTLHNPEENFTHAIYMWYNEVTKPGFHSSGLDSYVFDSATGHYTQVVWAETRAVGCGYVSYKEGQWYNQLYVCNYGPAGNVIGQSVYKRGPTISGCPKGRRVGRTFRGLCSA